MNSNKGIYGSIPMVAAAYADQFGVDIQFEGNQASTNGKSITLPCFGENVTDDMKMALWGYLAHESAHIRFTDFEVRFPSDIKGHLTNIFEDVRIENRMMERYPGSRITMDHVIDFMLDNKMIKAPDDSDPLDILTSFIFTRARSLSRNQKQLLPISNFSEGALRNHFDDAFISKLKVIVDKSKALVSTFEAEALAIEVCSLIQDQIPPQQSQPNESEPQSDQVESQSDEGQSQSDQAQSQSDEAQSQSDQAQSQSDQTQSQSDQANHHSNESAQQHEEMCRALLEVKLDSVDPMEVLKKELFKNNSHQHWQTSIGEVSLCNLKHVAFNFDQNVGHLRSRLMKKVMDSKRSKKVLQDYGRLEPRELSRIIYGETNVFSMTNRTKAPNTAVHILGDYSSSMDSVSGVVSQACFSTALALNDLVGVNPGVTYFGGYSSTPVCPVLDHGQNPRHVRRDFARKPSGGTPMLQAL